MKLPNQVNKDFYSSRVAGKSNNSGVSAMKAVVKLPLKNLGC